MKNDTPDCAVHMVSACLPQALQRLNAPSRLKAIRPISPRSSISVKSGKKIAIGGSITATTRSSVRKTPQSSSSLSQSGTPIDTAPA